MRLCLLLVSHLEALALPIVIETSNAEPTPYVYNTCLVFWLDKILRLNKSYSEQDTITAFKINTLWASTVALALITTEICEISRCQAQSVKSKRLNILCMQTRPNNTYNPGIDLQCKGKDNFWIKQKFSEQKIKNYRLFFLKD